MKKLFPILASLTFVAGAVVGGYIASIVLDKSLEPRVLKKRKAPILDADDLSEEEAEELYETLSREINEEVMKEYDEGHSS